MYKNNFLATWQKNKEILIKNNVYREEDEHASCGVGLIASISGEPSRKVVEIKFVYKCNMLSIAAVIRLI